MNARILRVKTILNFRTVTIAAGLICMGLTAIALAGEIIPADVNIDPDVINLASSHGRWVNCTIALPAGYPASAIFPNSIYLNDSIQAVYKGVDTETGVLSVKFVRSELLSILAVGEVEVTITGVLIFDGTTFEGTDTIKVIDVGHGHGS